VLTEDGGGQLPLGAIGVYQVVRVGVHLVGVPEGMVLSGQVPLPVEFGHPAPNAILSNVVFYPDPWEVGGLAIYVGAQTIYTGGTWALDIYDDQDTHVGHLQGYVAADGYCNHPGIPGPGFSLDNTDGWGPPSGRSGPH
jgi:hypothetical protein